MSIHLEAVHREVDGAMHLADVDLALTPGRIHALLGRTGAGKTTLLRLIAGLERPTQGRVLADGVDASTIPLRRRNVAFVYEQFVNYPSFTVFQNIAAPLTRAGRHADAIAQRVAEVARMLHIEHLLDRLPGQLSGGQQQRVAIARALAKDADVLLLDEPLVNLDYKLREELRAELRALFRSTRCVVVYTTTDPHEALQLGGDVSVVDAGRVLQTGAVAEVFTRPATARVAQIFSDPPMNLVEGRLDERELAIGVLRLPRPGHMRHVPSGPCCVGVRPSHLHLDDVSGVGSFSGELLLSEVNGSESYLHVRAGQQDWTLHLDGVHPVAIGTPLRVGLDSTRLYLFDGVDGALLATPDQDVGPTGRATWQ